MNQQQNNIENSRYTSRNFIKGKIVELIFEHMFRDTKQFLIVPFGYEKTLPEIAQHLHTIKHRDVLDNVRSAPDFALISADKTEVFLVEVKYRKDPKHSEFKRICIDIENRWKHVWIFLATPTGFHLDSCENIIKNEGIIADLSFDKVSAEIQQEHLKLLQDFIRD